MTIADELQNRGINELLHFTTHRGVVGTINHRQGKTLGPLGDYTGRMYR